MADLCNITGFIYYSDGTPAASKNFSLSSIDWKSYSNGGVSPKTVSFSTDAFGAVDFSVAPGAYTLNPEDFEFSVDIEVPDLASANIKDIL